MTKPGQRVAQLRKAAGLTQRATSEITGISKTRIGAIERDTGQPLRVNELEAICIALNCDANAIVHGASEDHAPPAYSPATWRELQQAPRSVKLIMNLQTRLLTRLLRAARCSKAELIELITAIEKLL